MDMKITLNHIGLHIKSREELVDFYQNILGFHREYQFELSSVLASKIFDIDKQSEVFYCKNGNVCFELFVHAEKAPQGFAHICIDVIDREIIAKKCGDAGYPVTRIERSDKPDILFIEDKSENIFELKNIG